MKSSMSRLWIAATLIAIISSGAIAQDFRAGAATSNITLPLGARNGGVISRGSLAANIHDELYARCIVLDDGKFKVAIAVCDLRMISRDVIDAARETLAGAQVAPRIRFSPGDLIPFSEVETRWYVRLQVDDQPGVLAKIAAAFGDAGVSIRSVWQEGVDDEAALIVVTHRAMESNQRSALAVIESIDEVIEVGSVIRVLGDTP